MRWVSVKQIHIRKDISSSCSDYEIMNTCIISNKCGKQIPSYIKDFHNLKLEFNIIMYFLSCFYFLTFPYTEMPHLPSSKAGPWLSPQGWGDTRFACHANALLKVRSDENKWHGYWQVKSRSTSVSTEMCLIPLIFCFYIQNSTCLLWGTWDKPESSWAKATLQKWNWIS